MRDKPLVEIVFPSQQGRRDESRRTRRDFAAFPMRPLPLFVLAALARREGWDARVIDENLQSIPRDDPPDLAMITVWTCTAPSAYQLADRYRADGVPVVLGGVHPSMMPGEALQHADAVVTSEAEAIMPELLADAAAGRLRPLYEGSWLEMDKVPFTSEYADIYAGKPFKWATPIHGLQTSRGCRFNCDFCSVIRVNGRGMRHMEVDRVVDELKYLATLPPRLPGGTPVYLHDDDLYSDPEYTTELFEAIIRSGIKVHLVYQASIGIARDPHLLDLAGKAGSYSIYIGFESVARESLLEANKKNRPHEYKELIGRIHDRGIGVTAGIIFGFDNDEPDVFDHTVDFIQDMGADSAHFHALTPLPGTHTFARFHQDGRIVDYDWGKFDALHAVIEPERMTNEQLADGLWRAYRRFNAGALRWQRFRRLVRTHPLRVAAGFGLAGRRYGSRLDEMEERTSPGYVPTPEHLAQLLRTSQAPASEAINMATMQLHEATPVELRVPSAR